jgi:hypothetical protein
MVVVTCRGCPRVRMASSFGNHNDRVGVFDREVLPMRGLVAALLVALSLSACSGSGTPAGGLNQSEAFTAARAAASDATGVVSGKVGHMRDFDTNQQVVAGDQWVWAVVVSGSFPFSCPAPVPGQTHRPCPPPGKTETVILDYKTGKFLETFGQSGS